MKTKLGVSVGLFGAAMYLVLLFGGYTPAVIMAGYILLFEENDWLKKTAVKALALTIAIAFLTALINLIPDILAWIGTFVSLFEGKFEYKTVSTIVSIIVKAIDFIRTCLYLTLGAKALSQSTVAIPFVDNLVNKYI